VLGGVLTIIGVVAVLALLCELLLQRRRAPELVDQLRRTGAL
jgi:hypothetical protein